MAFVAFGAFSSKFSIQKPATCAARSDIVISSVVAVTVALTQSEVFGQLLLILLLLLFECIENVHVPSQLRWRTHVIMYSRGGGTLPLPIQRCTIYLKNNQYDDTVTRTKIGTQNVSIEPTSMWNNERASDAKLGSIRRWILIRFRWLFLAFRLYSGRSA